MEKNYRISKTDYQQMIATALFFDVLQILFGGFFQLMGFVPVIGWVVFVLGFALTNVFTIFAWLTFYIWFNKKDIFFFRFGKRQAPAWIARIVEIFFGILPGWTLAVFFLVRASRKEDQEKEQKIQLEVIPLATHKRAPVH